MEQFGKLYIYNYISQKDGSYYFITKWNDIHYFVRLNNQIVNQTKIAINKNNQLYLIYSGLFNVDNVNHSITLIDWS